LLKKKKKRDESKINTLIYCMGTEAEDILAFFKLTDENCKKYDMVKARFEAH